MATGLARRLPHIDIVLMIGLLNTAILLLSYVYVESCNHSASKQAKLDMDDVDIIVYFELSVLQVHCLRLVLCFVRRELSAAAAAAALYYSVFQDPTCGVFCSSCVPGSCMLYGNGRGRSLCFAQVCVVTLTPKKCSRVELCG